MAKRQVVIVLETTGTSVIDKDHDKDHKNRVIEIALVELMDGKIISERAYYLNPRMAIPEGATRLHGLTQADLVNAVDFKNIAREFLTFIRNKNVIVHNRHFVTEFLNSELAEAGITRKKIEDYCSEIIDTLALARGLHGNKGNSLDALAIRYGLADAPRFTREGLRDAKLIAKVYGKLLMEEQLVRLEPANSDDESIECNSNSSSLSEAGFFARSSTPISLSVSQEVRNAPNYS